MHNTPTLPDLEALARQAGDLLRRGFPIRPGSELNLNITHKGAIDLVTEMDRRSEEFLLAKIQQRFPSHRIVSEESGAHAGDICCQWYIDPLDGTVNYAHGIPIYSVSIAYAEGGVVRLGVVYDPMRDECFSAERDVGAYLNGLPIRPSNTPTLDQSLLVTGFAYDIRTNPQTNLDHYSRLALRSLAVRRLGSAALDLCYIACGRFDGYWELRLHPWDMAAGGLIAQEAGAIVTAFDGNPEYLKPPYSLVAANPLVHPQLLADLQNNLS